MSEELEKAILNAVTAARDEWRLRYPDYLASRIRLDQLARAIVGLAESHHIELPDDERLQMYEFREFHRPHYRQRRKVQQK